MATIGINAGLETLWEAVDDLDQIGQADFFPRFLQGSFQRFLVRMGFLACFLHQDAPYCVVERVEIGAVGRPLALRQWTSTVMTSGQLSRRKSWVSRALWAGAPSCWNVHSSSPKMVWAHGMRCARKKHLSRKETKKIEKVKWVSIFATPCIHGFYSCYMVYIRKRN